MTKKKPNELQKAKKRLIASAKSYHALKEFQDYKLTVAKLKAEVEEWKQKYELRNNDAKDYAKEITRLKEEKQDE